MSQAVESLHAADGMFHRNAGFCMLKPKVEPQVDTVEPFQFGVEYLFHERVVVDASGKETEEEEDLPVQGRDGDGLERVAFFLPL